MLTILVGWDLEFSFVSAGSFYHGWAITAEEEHVRTFLITLTALGAVAVVLPTVTANAQDRTVIVTKDRDHDRGLHRGWSRGHHYGWRNHNAKVVVIKKSRHHHYD
jgi:hypothetical protein